MRDSQFAVSEPLISKDVERYGRRVELRRYTLSQIDHVNIRCPELLHESQIQVPLLCRRKFWNAQSGFVPEHPHHHLNSEVLKKIEMRRPITDISRITLSWKIFEASILRSWLGWEFGRRERNKTYLLLLQTNSNLPIKWNIDPFWTRYARIDLDL